MSTGHLDEEPASRSQVIAFLRANPDCVAHLCRPPVINRGFRLAYLGGKSLDGETTYIDEKLPEVLPKNGYSADPYIHLHEDFEWWRMVKLGVDYLGEHREGGHPYAVGLEHMALMADPVLIEFGIIPPDSEWHDPDPYEDELAAYIREDEAADLEPDELPPDLFLGPYEDDQDALDRRLLPFLKAAAVPSTGQKLDHATVSYGPGHAPEFCHTCEYYTAGECRYVAEIVPDGWCVIWEAA